MKLSLRRLIAYWLDFMFLALFLVVIQWLLYITTAGFPFDVLDTGYEIEAWLLLTMSLPVWSYYVFCEKLKQQTLGKRILRIRVCHKDGSNINFYQAFLRTFIRLIPWELTHIIILIPTPWWSIDEPTNQNLLFIPNILMILYIIVLLANKGHKALHDYIAGTRVQIKQIQKTSKLANI